jgi:hypothetical protein
MISTVFFCQKQFTPLFFITPSLKPFQGFTSTFVRQSGILVTLFSKYFTFLKTSGLLVLIYSLYLVILLFPWFPKDILDRMDLKIF